MNRSECKYVSPFKIKGFYAVYYCSHPSRKNRGCITDECPLPEFNTKKEIRKLTDRYK